MNTNDPDHPGGAAEAKWSGGLSDLSGVSLDERHEEMFSRADARCGGNAVWRQRKRREFREFLALAQVSSRIKLMMADLSAAFRIMFELRAPVPTMPTPGASLEVVNRALIGLTYREEALRLPQPGYAFVGIHLPNHVWLPNVAPSDPAFTKLGSGQALCLGAELPAGMPVKELVLQTFAALTLQSIQLDERDPAGIMNPPAAKWYLQNRERIPLTREGFLEFKSTDADA
jgi:hypothetical protein